MLKSVRFKDYKSFTQETTIDLIADSSEILKSTNTYNNLLKGCCFFGSNSSGKSNALNAITLLLHILFDKKINFENCVTFFDYKNKEQTMYFEYKFVIENKEITYYFMVNRKGELKKETLSIDDILIYSYEKEHILDPYSILKNTKFKQGVYLKEIIKKKTNNKILDAWFKYLKNSFALDTTDSCSVNNLVKKDKSYLEKYLKKNGVNEMNDFLINHKFPFTLKYDNKEDVPLMMALKFVRANKEIPLFLESKGNMTLVSILPMIFSVTKIGGIIALDEFCNGLHNKLEELLIRYVFENSKNTQLFFVSHSTNLLKTSLLRPDQIYSVDFGDDGSILRKFSSENPRESQNLEKMYLAGVFGGIPLYE